MTSIGTGEAEISALLDSSVLIAALAPDEDCHAESLGLLMQGGNVVNAHAFLETFSILTGGKLGVRVEAGLAAQLLNETLNETVLPCVRVVDLGVDEILAALRHGKKHGVRGGAVYDFMHLIAARKAGAAVLYTLNIADFQSLRREGDPEIRRP